MNLKVKDLSQFCEEQEKLIKRSLFVCYDDRKEFLAVEIGPGSSEPCFKACVTPPNILKVSPN